MEGGVMPKFKILGSRQTNSPDIVEFDVVLLRSTLASGDR